MSMKWTYNPQHVYRLVDPKGEVYYIGVTGNPEKREKELRRTSWWRKGGTYEVVATFLYDRRAAYAYENQLIREHRPHRNVQGNPDRKTVAEAAAAEAAA